MPLGDDKSYSILKRGCLVQINLFGHPSPSSVNSQGSSDLNSRMRIILFDWIATVALKFDYSADTAITTMRIVDQYTKVRPVPVKKYQLVGIAALVIASKVDEVEGYAMEAHVRVCDDAYSMQEIIEMESNICTALEFEFDASRIGITASFLSRIADANLHKKGSIILLASHIFQSDLSRSNTVSARLAYLRALKTPAGTEKAAIGEKMSGLVLKLGGDAGLVDMKARIPDDRFLLGFFPGILRRPTAAVGIAPTSLPAAMSTFPLL